MLTQAFVLTFVMAGGDDSVMWLRVKDEDIDAAELLRVKVSTTGSGKKRRFVCTGTLYKGKDDHMREYAHARRRKDVSRQHLHQQR